jgi:hypothetical protein
MASSFFITNFSTDDMMSLSPFFITLKWMTYELGMEFRLMNRRLFLVSLME